MATTWRSSSGASPDTSGPRAKCDQVIYEAIAKAAEIIVQSRCPVVASQSSSSSTRFNLHVPELESVRSILQQWRLSLHVPLRLDVYYQHEDRRELLERWCLQYSPSSGITDFSSECASPDPLVQLRHVCKKIVVWLRTLYSMSRLLPAHRLLVASQKMHFSMDIDGVWQDLPQFQQQSLPTVPTPYGPLQWKVCYAPNVARLLGHRTKAQPIPMLTVQKQNHIAIPTQAQSAPAHAPDQVHYMTSQAATFNPQRRPSRRPVARSNSLSGPDSTSQELSPRGQRPIVQRSNSLKPEEEQRSGLSLALEQSSAHRRTALHHPPPNAPQPETYGYAYNCIPPATTAMRTTTPTNFPLSSSPIGMTPPLSSTPPPMAGSLPRQPTLIPPRSNTTTPPFAALPTVLSEPQLLPDGDEKEQDSTLLPPITSLDLLHASPFKSGGSALSSFTESEALKHSMKHSSMIVPPDSHDFAIEEEDMPFAVDDAASMEESAVASLAHKCATANRLQLFESQTAASTNDMVSSLADQLADFKSFGASLHASQLHGGSNANSSGNAKPASGNDGSTSTLISTRS